MADNKLQSLAEIFNEKIFRIPDFQRGYSWQERELEDFWGDLTNLNEDKIHYTGLLAVESVNRKDVEKVEKWQDDLWLLKGPGLSAYYVIDGQQRLTTAIIFIHELLKCFRDDEGINFINKGDLITKYLYRQYEDVIKYKSYIFGYEKDNPSDEYFKTKILEQKSSAADKVPEQTLYTVNLKFAKQFFGKKLKQKSKSELNDLFKKVTNQFRFNFYEIDDDLDVCVTFETMNNRGKSLSNIERLKNRLIYLTTILDGKGYKQLRRDINEAWKTIYEYLGKNEAMPLDDDDFLKNHWIMYFRYDRKESASYAKFLLDRKFTAKDIRTGKLTAKDIKRYIDSLQEAVKSWFYLFNPELSYYEDETKEWLQKLNRLGMGAFQPLFMAAMSKKFPENEIQKLLQTAERFVFLVFKLSQRRSDTGNSEFYRQANLLYFEKGGHNIGKVIEDIDWMTEGEEGEGEEYRYRGWFDLKRFNSDIKDLYEKDDGYYSWNGLRYFLYEYELHLQNSANGNQKVTWADFNKRKKEDTIEHIYPQEAKDKSWRTSFAGYKFKQKKKLLHSLGNLLLLSRSKNSELQNNSFSYKKKHINKNGKEVGYFNGSYSEIDVAKHDNWTPNEIFDRGRELITFLIERWDIDYQWWEFASEEELLQLEFMQNSLD